MVNLNDYKDSIIKKYNITDENVNEDFLDMLAANEWFGEKPIVIGNTVMVPESFIDKGEKIIDDFFKCHFLSEKEKRRILEERLDIAFPDTFKAYRRFRKAFDLPDEVSVFLIDFLLCNLPGEIQESTDAEMESIVENMVSTVPVSYARQISDFINWVGTHYKTVYVQAYIINNYTSDEENNGAYSVTEYLRILFRLFNKDYIEENLMYEQAASSKKYIDAWLFLSLHFVCALRKTDLVRFPHPVLPEPPEDVLEDIRDGAFSDENAKLVLCSVITHMMYIPLKPNKTKNIGNVTDVKLHIPTSVEVHFGRLLAISEAHHQLKGLSEDDPLIHPASDYESITRAMGDDIGELFLNMNFRSRKANKSFMQIIELMTDEILGSDENEYNVNGYILAAYARSHKGSFGEFAKTTMQYLKDNKLSGFTPEFVARELFERGVLSFSADMLLKMVGGKTYTKLDAKSQTKMIGELGLSPGVIEDSIALVQKSYNQAVDIAKEIYEGGESEKDILSALNCIGNGTAFSKQGEIQCLLTAFRKACPYGDRTGCISCEYEISSKATMFLMASEYKRLLDLYNTETNLAVKEKYKHLAQKTVVPKMFEMIKCMEENYGEEPAETLKLIVAQSTKK